MTKQNWPSVKSNELRERAELACVRQRLVAMYSPLIAPEDVKRCVDQVAASFEGARVRTFIAVLVERKSVVQLRRWVEVGDHLSVHEQEGEPARQTVTWTHALEPAAIGTAGQHAVAALS